MKPTVIDPKTTTRAEAYALWMDAPNPMVTFFKTLDVAPLIRFSRRRGMKFNMLLCFCIGKAASEIKEFYMLPVGRELLKYDIRRRLRLLLKTGQQRLDQDCRMKVMLHFMSRPVSRWKLMCRSVSISFTMRQALIFMEQSFCLVKTLTIMLQMIY